MFDVFYITLFFYMQFGLFYAKFEPYLLVFLSIVSSSLVNRVVWKCFTNKVGLDWTTRGAGHARFLDLLFVAGGLNTSSYDQYENKIVVSFIWFIPNVHQPLFWNPASPPLLTPGGEVDVPVSFLCHLSQETLLHICKCWFAAACTSS